MTLRQYLARDRYQIYYWVGTFGSPAVFLALLLSMGRHFGPMEFILVFGFWWVASIFSNHLYRLIRCPRCSARLGELAYLSVMRAIGGRRWPPDRATAARKAEMLGKCPHCGLRLDEAIDAAEPK